MFPYRGVLFDLFYTLINPLAPAYMGENEYEVLGMSRGDFEYRNTAGYGIWAGGGVRDPVELVRRILAGLDFPEEQIRAAARARLERIRGSLFGVEEKNLRVLAKLREGGIKTALVSNADVIDTRYWQGSPLAACFDATVFSCDAGILKPDPRIYRLALEEIGLPASACLYVGDGGHEELKGAKEAGLSTALTVEYIRNLWPEKIPALSRRADLIIHNLEDILSLDEPVPVL
jgi:putative hydrolase of the HAD superfamily